MAHGSIRRLDGGWGYRVDLGNDPATGKRRQASKQGFRTRNEAEVAMQELLSEARAGVVANRSGQTLGAFLDEWLVLQRDRLRPSTLYSYDVIVERIKAGLGQAKIQAITPLQIEHFYATLIESGGRRGQGLSGKTVRNTHVVLRKALADAERLDIVARNAAGAAKPPTAERPENPTWSSEQLREFLDYLKDDRLRGAFVVLATTGMRRGEVLGLRWRDIDFDSAEMSVRHSITTAGPGKVVAGPPKTPRSRRQIYLDDATLRELREQRRKQNEERLAVGELWEAGEGNVFTDEIGRPVHPDKFSELFRKRMAEAELPKIRLHDLRHSYATLALKAGVHPKVVSERLGHATVGITLDTYSHVTPSIAREAADAVASRILD